MSMNQTESRVEPFPVRSGHFGPGCLGWISGVNHFGSFRVGRSGPISKVGRFNPILRVSRFGLIYFLEENRLDIGKFTLILFDQAGISRVQYLMVSS